MAPMCLCFPWVKPWKGFKYPLDHYQLKDREGLGVSNEITADVADVSWEQGVLLMIQSKD